MQGPFPDLRARHRRQSRPVDLGLGARHAGRVGRLLEQRQGLHGGLGGRGLDSQAVEGRARPALGHELPGQPGHPVGARFEQDAPAEVASRLGVPPQAGEALPHRVVERGAMPAVLVAGPHELVLHHLALAADRHEDAGIELGGEGEGAAGLGQGRLGLPLRQAYRVRGQPLRFAGPGGRGEQERRGQQRDHARGRGRRRARRFSASASVSSFLQKAKRTWRRPDAGSR